MSNRSGFFSGWTFRSNYPVFEPGQKLEAYITDFDPEQGTAHARIGDTILTVHGVTAEDFETIVPLRIRSFDTATHQGIADRAESR